MTSELLSEFKRLAGELKRLSEFDDQIRDEFRYVYRPKRGHIPMGILTLTSIQGEIRRKQDEDAHDLLALFDSNPEFSAMLESQMKALYLDDIRQFGYPRTPAALEARNAIQRQRNPIWLFLPQRIEMNWVTRFLIPNPVVLPSIDREIYSLIGNRWSIDETRTIVVSDFETIDCSLQRGLCDAFPAFIGVSRYNDDWENCHVGPQWVGAEIGVRDRMEPLMVRDDNVDTAAISKIVRSKLFWQEGTIPFESLPMFQLMPY